MNIEYLTYTNYGFVDFAKNNILNFNAQFNSKDKLTIVALDTQAFDDLTNFNSSKNITIKKLNTQFRDETNFNSAEFKNITFLKLQIIYQKLLRSEVIHFFDGDVFFFKNPRPYIEEKIVDNDAVFQQDSPRNDGHILYSNYVCTGNFSIKNNERSLKLLDTIIKNNRGQDNDQGILYNYLNSKCKNIKEYKDCTLDIFDPELFQNGYDTFKFNWYEKPNVVAVHANHMIGKNIKIESLKKINAWLL